MKGEQVFENKKKERCHENFERAVQTGENCSGHTVFINKSEYADFVQGHSLYHKWNAALKKPSNNFIWELFWL